MAPDARLARHGAGDVLHLEAAAAVARDALELGVDPARGRADGRRRGARAARNQGARRQGRHRGAWPGPAARGARRGRSLCFAAIEGRAMITARQRLYVGGALAVLLIGVGLKEIEVGLNRVAPGNKQTARLFFAKLKEEIIAAPFDFGGFVGIANINLDKSERLGVELEHTADLTQDLEFRAAYTYLDASIQSGPLDGVRVPLVPSHRAQFGLNYDLSESTRVDFLLSAQSDQRIGGDLSTPQGVGHVPGYAVADLAVHRTFGKAKVSLAINNLFDRSYYSQAYFNFFGNPAPVGVYPDPERNMKLTARFDF